MTKQLRTDSEDKHAHAHAHTQRHAVFLTAAGGADAPLLPNSYFGLDHFSSMSVHLLNSQRLSVHVSLSDRGRYGGCYV